MEQVQYAGTSNVNTMIYVPFDLNLLRDYIKILLSITIFARSILVIIIIHLGIQIANGSITTNEKLSFTMVIVEFLIVDLDKVKINCCYLKGKVLLN